MVSEQGTAMSGLTRRALIFAAPSLLIPKAALAVLAPTPSANEGPFYPVRMPSDDDADLIRVEGAVRQAGGDILHLGGRVLDTDGRPIADVRIEIWQCDANGIYLHPGDHRIASRDTGFQGFGHTRSDAAGRFTFRTIVPVAYPGRTPHIHVKVLRNGRALLTTQLYRAGHSQNSSDFLFSRLAPDEQRRVSMVIRPHPASPHTVFKTAIDLVIGG